MARGTSLLRLVQMVREECGRSSAVGVSIGDVAGLKTKIQRAQEVLYDAHDWPHMKQRFPREDMLAGERYYDPTTGVNFDRIKEGGMVVWWNTVAYPIKRGITFADYSFYDSELDQRVDPVQKWDIVWTGTKEQIEFWPMPVSNNQQWQIEGFRSLRPLIADADVADLDDQLIALTVAAELLADKDAKSASLVAGYAAQRLNTLLGNAANNTQRYRMGMGAAEPEERTTVVLRVR